MSLSLKSIALAAIVLLPTGAFAQAYTPGEREELVQEAVPGLEGVDIAIQRVTFPGGWSGERHTHAGPVYVYVLEGSFEIEVDGEGERTLSAGDLVAEPRDTAMNAHNASGSEPVTILLIQISERGRPLMELVKE